jgi:hypothetical protein
MYALQTPIKRKSLEIKEEKPQIIEPRGANSDQAHRTWQWLHHKPQNYALTPRGESTRKKLNQ